MRMLLSADYALDNDVRALRKDFLRQVLARRATTLSKLRRRAAMWSPAAGDESALYRGGLQDVEG